MDNARFKIVENENKEKVQLKFVEKAQKTIRTFKVTNLRGSIMHKLNAIFTFWFALARIAKYEAVLNKNIKNSEDINYLNFMDNVKLSIFI